MFDTEHVLPELLENYDRIETQYKERFSEVRKRFEEGRLYPDIFFVRSLYEEARAALRKQVSTELIFAHQAELSIGGIPELSAMFDAIDVDCLIDSEELEKLFSFLWFLFEETAQLLKRGAPLHNELTRNVHATYRGRFVGGACGFVHISHYKLGFQPVDKLYSYRLIGKPDKGDVVYEVNLDKVTFSLHSDENEWSWFQLMPSERISLVAYDIPVACSTRDTAVPFVTMQLLRSVLATVGYSFEFKDKL